MTDQDEIAARLRDEAPALLSGDPAATARAEMNVSDLDFQGLAIIAAPTRVPGSPLPLALLQQKSALRGWEVPDEKNLVLSAFDPAAGTLRLGHLLRDPKSIEYPPPGLARPPRPPETDRFTIMTRIYRFDVREHLDLPEPAAGKVVLRVVAFDWMSNPAIVRMEGGDAPAAPVIVQPLPPGPAGGFPSYGCGAEHPPAPARGLAMTLAQRSDSRLVLLGRYARQAATRDLLPEPLRVDAGNETRLAVGVLRAGLLVLGLDQARPTVATLGLPVFAPSVPAIGQRIEGCFAFDLMQFGAFTMPGRYAVYLFLDDEVYGPITAEIVSAPN